MPRPKRLQVSVSSPVYQHCVSRVVDRRFVFGAHERDVFRRLLRQVEQFSGVRVVTWTILSNHLHLLLEIPPPPPVPLSDAQILERCQALYSPRSMDRLTWEFEEAQRLGGSALADMRHKYLVRMWNLSEFMKTLKQKFTIWFNRKHSRTGTLWESRFTSVLVEGCRNCLLKVAAYIDLNAVRAGIVADPKDYRWCGYAEAVAGDRPARRGLAIALGDTRPDSSWGEVGSRYRKLLFGIGEETLTRSGISRAEVAKVWAAGGALSLAQLLRCRVRYFTAGFAVGSESFIEAVVRSRQDAFSPRRKAVACKMEGGDWGELRSARSLSICPITPPGGG